MAMKALDFYNLTQKYIHSDEHLKQDDETKRKELEAFNNHFNKLFDEESSNMDDVEFETYKSQFKPYEANRQYSVPQGTSHEFSRRIKNAKNTESWKNLPDNEKAKANKLIGQKYRELRLAEGLPIEPIDYNAKEDAARQVANQYNENAKAAVEYLGELAGQHWHLDENQPKEVKDLTWGNAAKAAGKSVARIPGSAASTALGFLGGVTNIAGKATGSEFLQDLGTVMGTGANSLDAVNQGILPPEQKQIEGIKDIIPGMGDRTFGQKVLTGIDQLPEQIGTWIMPSIMAKTAKRAVTGAKAYELGNNLSKSAQLANKLGLHNLNPEKVEKIVGYLGSSGLELSEMTKKAFSDQGEIKDPTHILLMAGIAGYLEDAVPSKLFRGSLKPATRAMLRRDFGKGAWKTSASFIKNLGKDTFNNLKSEGLTELLQTYLEQAAANRNAGGSRFLPYDDVQKIGTLLNEKGIDGVLEEAKNNERVAELVSATILGGLSGGLGNIGSNAANYVSYNSSPEGYLDRYRENREVLLNAFNNARTDEERNQRLQELNRLDKTIENWKIANPLNTREGERNSIIRSFDEMSNPETSEDDLKDAIRTLAPMSEEVRDSYLDILKKAGFETNDTFNKNYYDRFNRPRPIVNANTESDVVSNTTEPQTQIQEPPLVKVDNGQQTQPQTSQQDQQTLNRIRQLEHQKIKDEQEKEKLRQQLVEQQKTGFNANIQGQPFQNGKRGFIGNEARLKAGDIDTKCNYAVVELSDLQTLTAEENPRQRNDRQAYANTVSERARNLDPDLLIDNSVGAQNGPIVVDQNLKVESGNGRTLSLREAYANRKGEGEYSNTETDAGYGRADLYRNKLIAEAPKYGISSEQVMQMKEPVLVRIRVEDSNINTKDFYAKANNSQQESMSSTETALVDGNKIKPLLKQFEAIGDIRAKSNLEFVRSFLEKICSPYELNSMFTADGHNLSEAGEKRINNAIIAAAYGDTEIVSLLTELGNEDVQTILNGLAMAAPDTAKLMGEAQNGNVFDVDISTDLADAIKTIKNIRQNPNLKSLIKQFGSVSEVYLKQGTLGDDGLSPSARLLIGVLGNLNNKETIRDFLKEINKAVRAEGSPKQIGMFEANTKPSNESFVETAIRNMDLKYKDGSYLADDIERLKKGPASAVSNDDFHAEDKDGKRYSLGNAYHGSIDEADYARRKSEINNNYNQKIKETESDYSDPTGNYREALEENRKRDIEEVESEEEAERQLQSESQNENTTEVDKEEFDNYINNTKANLDPSLGINIVTFESVEDFNKTLERGEKKAPGNTEGFTDLKNGRIVIIRKSLKNLERAKQVLSHELLGHAAIKFLLGNHYRYAMEAFSKLARKDQSARRILQEVLHLYRNEYKNLSPAEKKAYILEELGAHLAEKYHSEPQSLGERVVRFLRRVKLWLRDKMRNLGLDVEADDIELENIFEKSRDVVARNGKWNHSATYKKEQDPNFGKRRYVSDKDEYQDLYNNLSSSKQNKKFKLKTDDKNQLRFFDYDIEDNQDYSETDDYEGLLDDKTLNDFQKLHDYDEAEYGDMTNEELEELFNNEADYAEDFYGDDRWNFIQNYQQNGNVIYDILPRILEEDYGFINDPFADYDESDTPASVQALLKITDKGELFGDLDYFLNNAEGDSSSFSSEAIDLLEYLKTQVKNTFYNPFAGKIIRNCDKAIEMIRKGEFKEGVIKPISVEELERQDIKKMPEDSWEARKRIMEEKDLVEDSTYWDYKNKTFYSLGSEAKQIKQKAIDNGTFLKAPNGKDSNLNENQWIEARTQKFKDSFGDWELVKDVSAKNEPLSDKDTEKIIKKWANQELINDKTGIKAKISATQRNKLISKAAKRKSAVNGFSANSHNQAVAIIDKLFKHARLLMEHSDRNNDPNIKSMKRFISPIFIDEGPAVAYLTVKESMEHGHRIYSLELTDIEKLEGSVSELVNKHRSASSFYDKKLVEFFENIEKFDRSKLDENGEPKAEYLKSASNSSIVQKGKLSSKRSYSLGTDGQRLTNPESDNLEDLYNNIMNGSEDEYHDNDFVKDINSLSKSEDRRYALAGEKAKTANIARLNKAKRMLADGEDKKTVWQKTGWYIAKDGKPRFEIADDKFKIKKSVLKEISHLDPDGVATYRIRLRDAISHRKLFAAYPDLNLIDITFTFDEKNPGSLGEFQRDMRYSNLVGNIRVNVAGNRNVNDIKSTIIHEIQHAIQNYEGFAEGSTPEYEMDKLKKSNFYNSRLAEQNLRQTIEDLNNPTAERIAWDYANLFREFRKAELDFINEGTDETFNKLLELGDQRNELKKQFVDSYKSNEPLKVIEKNVLAADKKEREDFLHDKAYENYRKSYGEGEARAVENRLDYADFERDEIMPEDDFDYNIDESVISGVEDDEYGYTSESNNTKRYSLVSNPKVLNKLESEPTVKVYRAMQLIDGKLYPPMAAKIEGKGVKPTEFGKWYQADENPDIIIWRENSKGEKVAYFKLDKANGKSIYARYAPYWHTSRTPLNDQFKEAWNRHNLVTVECEIPESELTSGYTAQYAEKPVGKTEWHEGPVANRLGKVGKPRRVILSRWNKVTRIVPESEVADVIAKTLKDTGIGIPENTVTPSLLEELKKRDVIIEPPEKGQKKSNDSMYDRFGNRYDGKPIRFSLSSPVEQTKNLIAVHNLHEDELLESLNLGGLPMPSIAIVKDSMGHNNYGEISVVFNKDTIDPRFFRSNKVYSGDAYTPSFPKLGYKINTDKCYKIRKKIEKTLGAELNKGLGSSEIDEDNLKSVLSGDGEIGLVRRYKNNAKLKALFLLENALDFETVYKERELDSSFNSFSNKLIKKVAEKYGKEKINRINEGYEEIDQDIINDLRDIANEDYIQSGEAATVLKYIKDYKPYDNNNFGFAQADSIIRGAIKYFDGSNNLVVDKSMTENRMNEALRGHKEEYSQWLDNLFDGIVEKKGIRNDKDAFTSIGNHRSFESLHYEYNLENIVKAMKKEDQQGANSFGGYDLFGSSTTMYDSIDSIKEDSDRLRLVPEEEYDNIRKEFQNRFNDITDGLANNKNSWESQDSVKQVLLEAVVKCKTKPAMERYISREFEGWAELKPDTVDNLIELVKDIRKMPTGYFEAKPQRAVGLDEIEAVIIPNTTSQKAIEAINKAGIKTVTYDASEKGDRLKKLNEVADSKEGIRFSLGSSDKRQQIEDSSQPYDYTKPFAQQLDDFEQNKMPAYNSLLVSYTPTVLREIGFVSLPVTINQEHIGYALKGNYKGNEEEVKDHIIPKGELAKLPQKIADPVAIIQDKQVWKDNASQYVVDILVTMKVNGKDVLVPVRIGGRDTINGQAYDCNVLTTVHGDKDTVDRLINAINEDSDDNYSLYFLNNEKAKDIIRTYGNPIPTAIEKFNGFIHSITDSASPVKPRINSQTDTIQFKRWFGKSIMTEDGRAGGKPKVFYHGTDQYGFDVFRDNSFFTDDEQFAKRYEAQRHQDYKPGTYEVYLRIEKPFDIRNPKDRKIFTEYRNGHEPTQTDSGAMEWTDFDYDELTEYLKENYPNKYDGYVIQETYNDSLSYVPFEKSQIKSATDNIGTFDRNNGNIRYSLSSYLEQQRKQLEDYVDGKMGIKLSDDEKDTIKAILETDDDADLDLNDIPSFGDRLGSAKESLTTLVGQLITGLIGDTESRADRKKAPYLWQKDHSTEKVVETPYEISRRTKIEQGMKTREEEDKLVLKHLDADKNFFTGLIRRMIKPGALQDWMLKKASRILAPFQIMKPVEQLLFTVAENIMWDEAKQQMVIAPYRDTEFDKQTNKPIGYKYDSNEKNGRLALDIYNNKLNDEFKAIIKERSIANNKFREDFVNRVVPFEQAKLYLARFGRKRLEGAGKNIVEGNDRQAYSYITRLKGVIDDTDYNELISQYDQIKNIPDEQLGRNSAFINSIIGELAGNPAITANGIDAKLNWLTTNKGLYGYAHHLVTIDPETGSGKPFNALGKISHPWIESIAGDRRGRKGDNSEYRSLLRADLERNRKEAEAEAANRWMEATENTYGITLEEAKNLEKLQKQGKGPGMPEGYEHRHKVIANFGKFRGKVIYLPDETFEAYQMVRDNRSLDSMKQFKEFLQKMNNLNGRINEAMLWHPGKAMRDLMAGPFHLLEFLRDWSMKHPTEINDALKATWKGIKNSVSPEYWQSHTPESMGEYSESVIYQTQEGQSPTFGFLDSLFKYFQKAIPVGRTAEAIYKEVNFAGAADIPLKRIFTTIGEELADKRGLTGQERERFIYDMVNDYAFDTGDLPEILAWLRGKKADKKSQALGMISRATVPFMGYATRMIKQMITDPVTKGAVPLAKRAFGNADSNSNLRSEVSEFSRPFFWLMLKALIAAGLGGILPPPVAEDVQDMPGVPPSARTHGRFYVGDSDKGERWMSTKGLGQLETAYIMDDYLKGKSDIIDFSSEFLTIHPVMKYIANLSGLYSEYDRKVPFTTQTGKMLAGLIFPELTTRFTEDLNKLVRAYMQVGTADRRKQTFIQAFIEKLFGIPAGEVQFDKEGHLRLSDPAIETMKMFGINIREIPFDTIEETTRAEASRIANDSKKIEKLRNYRSGKYAPKSEQEFLKQDFGGDFSSVAEAENYYSNIADRERKVVDTATKLYNKGHWTDLEEVAREKKELAAEKKKQQNEGKSTKRRRTTRRKRTERPLLNDDLNYINNDIRKSIYKNREEEYQDLYDKLMQNNKKHNPRRGVAGQLERLLKELD